MNSGKNTTLLARNQPKSEALHALLPETNPSPNKALHESSKSIASSHQQTMFHLTALHKLSQLDTLFLAGRSFKHTHITCESYTVQSVQKSKQSTEENVKRENENSLNKSLYLGHTDLSWHYYCSGISPIFTKENLLFLEITRNQGEQRWNHWYGHNMNDEMLDADIQTKKSIHKAVIIW